MNISVVIPTYNREKYIKAAIESVLDQKGQGKQFTIDEIVIVDDCSSDNTERIIKNISDRRIKYHKSDNNSGAGAARNLGVGVSNSNWIAFQDSDDKWHPDKLIKQVNYLDTHPEISMVSHPVRAVFDDGSEIITEAVSYENMVPYLADRNYFDTPTLLVRRDCFLEVGGFNVDLKALEDWDFSLRFADRYKIGMVPEVLIDSNMISDGVSSGAANYYESRCKMIALNKEILIKHNCFDEAVKSLLMHAKSNDVLDIVGKILELYLSA